MKEKLDPENRISIVNYRLERAYISVLVQKLLLELLRN